MSLTRKMLKAMGIDDDKTEQIIEAHTETVSAIKAERDDFKVKAEKLDDVQKELDKIKERGEKDPYKVRYEALKEEFDNYKKEVTAKETTATKTAAYKALLKEAGISDKRIDAVVKVSSDDIEKLVIKDGEIENKADLIKSVQADWSDFIVTTETRGASTATPPKGMTGTSTKTKEEILAIKDGYARRKEMAAHPELFGLAAEK